MTICASKLDQPDKLHGTEVVLLNLVNHVIIFSEFIKKIFQKSIFSHDERELFLQHWDAIFVEGSDMSGKDIFRWNFVGKYGFDHNLFASDVDVICSWVKACKQRQIDTGESLISFPQLNCVNTYQLNILKKALIAEGFLKEDQ